MKEIKNTDTEVYDITLLTDEEYIYYSSKIPVITNFWWLRTALKFREDDSFVLAIKDHKLLDSCRYNKDSGVRPLCLLKVPTTSDINISDKIKFGGYIWTVLDITSNKIYMLCDDVVAIRIFDEHTNVWEKSELFDWLHTEFLPELIEKAK